MLDEEQDPRSIPPRHDGVRAAGGPSLVVAIGAAAGSLDPLREFLEALDERAGMALIVVENSDPGMRSLTMSAIAELTSLPVSEVADGLSLTSDHVYVCPPSALVEVDAARLKVELLGASDHGSTPIDAVFRSLAASFGPRAVGIILSGVGTDGTLGVQQIANEGGMTLAQNPDRATYDSMPKSAIATGIVDHVLSAAEMAQVLLAYVSQVEQIVEDAGDPAERELIAQALPEICDLLNKATDHNFKHYKTSTLVRRIQRRMQVLRIGAVETYVDQLRNDQGELMQLFRELLIGVTAFFRDPEAFAALMEEVIRPLMRKSRGEPLRIWVPGCATGEEAYSLAIIVREAMHECSEPPEVQIFATDIDERALSIARQGVYPAGIAEDVSKERLERFFIKRGKRYQVTKEIRELCLFSPHNLINDPPFSRLDLISCRNLLIYFGGHLQKKLIPLFHYALRKNGYLFLGPSENISSHRDLFNPVNAKQRISQRKTTAISSSSWLASAGGPRGAARASDATLDMEPDLHQLMQRMLLDEFAPRAVIVTEEGQILSASGDMERFLTVTEGTFQNNLVRLARPGLRVGLRAALNEAIKVRRRVIHDKVSVQADSGLQRVRLTVQPMPRLGEEAELMLVVFQDLGTLQARESADHAAVAEADSMIEQLERELSSTREVLEKTIQDLEAANEELKSSNEELLSMNEELQSANEELETSKEEVQSSNEALARAHSNLSNLLTSTEIATIFLDDDLNIQSFTPAVTDIYNVLPTDVGRPLAHITHSGTVMPELPSPSSLRQTNKPLEHDVVTTAERWYLRRSLPYHDLEGHAKGMVVTFIDVTDLKRAEAASKRQEEQLELITDSLPVLISYVDSAQCYRFNNLAYQRWFGIPRESLRGKHIREVLGAAAYSTALPFIERALAGEAVAYEAEIPHHSGATRVVRAEYVPDRAADGVIRGYFSLKHDISEARKVAAALGEAKQTAEEASRAKSEFLANMSHEIRTPMMAILGYADVLQTHTTDPDNQACVDAIRRNGQHLTEIIDDILDLSRIEAGMLRADTVRFSPGGLVRDVVDGMRPRAAEKGLTLELIHDGPLPDTIESDPTRLRQVLLNLVGNAIKFTEAGGVRITVRLLDAKEQPEPVLEVEVSDSGIGILAADQDRIFEPFTQADSSGKRRHGGAGLGLAITKHLVELLGGRIRVASAQARGSTFSFTIATGSLEQIDVVSEVSLLPALAPAARLTDRRVLVVDDRPDVRYLVQTYLEEAGASVVGARDGAAAVDAVRDAIEARKPFDAVVLDMQMPVMDGYEATPLIRAAGHRGAILALTASAMKGDRDRCLAAGCGDYLAKPVDRLRLLQVLSNMMGVAEPGSPAVARAAQPAPVSESANEAGRILLVEDDADSSAVLAMLLEAKGFQVTIARTGTEAVERAMGARPDAVLLDIGLPDMNGYAVLEHLKELEALRNTTFIALSGRTSIHDDERIRDAGFHHRLVKPASIDKILALLGAPRDRRG